MAEKYYEIPDSPEYSTAIREIQDSDPVRASTVVNPVIRQMIENTHAVRQQVEELEAEVEGHTHSRSQITDFPDSLPASDVSAWAKAAQKPAYTAGEVGAAPASHTHTAAQVGAAAASHTHNYAAASHTHPVGEITGVLPTSKGGTGNSSGYIRMLMEGPAGEYSTAEGIHNLSSGEYSHAEGLFTTASGSSSHAEGAFTTASGESSHAEGNGSVASGRCSHAGGVATKALAESQCAIGKFNAENTSDQTKLIIGKGTSNTARANCFRVTDTGVYATGAHNTTGADYAEMFEWADGNPEGEDRAGRFVTIQGEKIRLAGPEDDYILGIVSGDPSVVGDVHDDQWRGMYLYDIFGRPLWEDVEVPDETAGMPDPEHPEQTVTRVIIPAHTEHRQKLNPDYDSMQTYIPRSERPEWDAVGMLGKLVAVDDGTCQVDGWCAPGEGGVATHAQTRTRYRVMARLDDTHIRVLVL